MKTNQAGIDLIKKFEGFESIPYLCPAGYWTVGYGHRLPRTSTDILPQHQEISMELAEIVLQQDLIFAEFVVNKLIISTLNENQFSALVSFVFNLGSGRLQSSTLRQKLNRSDYIGAAEEFLKWNRGGGKVLKGLVLRRQAERELFLL